MEEILASIRRIISDEGNSASEPAASARPAPQSPPLAATRPAPPATPEPDPSPDESDVLELTEVVETIAPGTFKPIEGHDVMLRDQEPAHEAPALRPAPALIYEKLLSQHAGNAVSAAFGSLANTMLTGESRTIDDLVREMLKPMLKTWLEDNLPSLVERLVRTEIERVSRGGR